VRTAQFDSTFLLPVAPTESSIALVDVYISVTYGHSVGNGDRAGVQNIYFSALIHHESF
jgi:hypothetical protein